MFANLMEDITSDEVLETAFTWLCKRRENYSHNDEVLRIRESWKQIKPQLIRQVLPGDYSFSPLRRVHRADDHLEIWAALDSLVLKAIAIVLTRRLAPRLSERYTHLVGNGGAKAAVREVAPTCRPTSLYSALTSAATMPASATASCSTN